MNDRRMIRRNWWRAVVVMAVLGPVTLARADVVESPVLLGVVRPVPIRRPGAGIPDATRVDAHLSYFGGDVVSHLRVVQVLWGDGDYLANVRHTTSPSIATFFQHVLASPYVDWLTEYDTPTETIGHGEFVGQFKIAPASANATVDDSEVVAELARQIAAAKLPQPDADTYYVVFFPAGVTITSPVATTCVDACGWHGSAFTAVGALRYGVQPDIRLPCQCHGQGGDFADVTSIQSHELVETITDPDPGLAWYDVTAPVTEGGEIGDICSWQQGTMLADDGVAYTLQKEWSNAAGDCILSKSGPCGDGTRDPNEECDDGNLRSGDGCSATCTIEPGPCPSWQFTADVSVPPSFFAVPGDAGRESGAQQAPNGSVLVSKDVGGNRWAITLDPVTGTVTGNVFDSTTGGATFLYCEPLFEGQWRCLSASSCRTSGRLSNIQGTPDGATTLVSKDVGSQRWAIGRTESDLAVTGNVYSGAEVPPVFLYCVPVEANPTALDCYDSPACKGGFATDCPSQWHYSSRVAHLPTDFFTVPFE